MNLRKNNGFVGTDISISIIILLVFVPIITGMIYNINKTNNSIQRKTQATNIAVNVIETANGMELDVLTADEIASKMIETYTSSNCYYTTLDSKEIFVVDLNDVVYQVEIEVTDYSEIDTDAKENVVKTVKTVITYKIGGNSETVELSSVIT